MKGRYPQINTLSDGHVHTRLCNHATGEMQDYVESALQKGLEEIIFLEHLEAGIDYFDRTWLNDQDFDYYFVEGNRLRQKYSGRITVGCGVEVGYNSRCSTELLDKLAQREWDRIGISCHFLQLPGTDYHLNLLSRKQHNLNTAKQFGVERLLTLYFETLIEAVSVIPGNVLCHLDAALRFLPGLQFSESHHKQIDLLLASVKARGMSIEINTSGFAIRQEPFPARQFLSMALRHRIPLVAGSDAHRPEDVSNKFDRLPAFIASSTTCP